MNSITLLFQGLDHDYTPDYWSDEVRIEMGRLIDNLTEEEWRELQAGWPAQSPGWRARFADASLLSEKPRVIPLLIEFLRSPEPAVGAAVAVTLAEKNYYWDPDVDLVTDLQRHLETATEQERLQLEKLRNRLPTKQPR